MNAHHEVHYPSLSIFVMKGTTKWHQRKAGIQWQLKGSVWGADMTQDPGFVFFFNIKALCKYWPLQLGGLINYWPKLVLRVRTNTQRGIKLVMWLKDQSNCFTWLVLICMNKRIIQQKVNSFCWEKHTRHHFHVGSLVKQNWRPHEVSQLFIFHLRWKWQPLKISCVYIRKLFFVYKKIIPSFLTKITKNQKTISFIRKTF